MIARASEVTPQKLQRRARHPMPDDLSKHGPADRTRVNVQETWEIEYWTGKWGCTKAELKAAVQAVGASAEKVEAYLMHHRHKRK